MDTALDGTRYAQVLNGGSAHIAERTYLGITVIDIDIECMTVTVKRASPKIISSRTNWIGNGDIGIKAGINIVCSIGNIHGIAEAVPVFYAADDANRFL